MRSTFRSEAPRFREVLENVRSRPGMYFGARVTYEAVSAFVLGYDIACEGGPLRGFQEWLIPRLGQGNNLGWPALVSHAAFPDSRDPDATVSQSDANQAHAIEVFFGLLIEFDDFRGTHDGLRQIYRDYDAWFREYMSEA